MAPRKEKVEKASAEQGSAMILDYLKKQNRPYSAIDISANLHNKVTKAYTIKALKELQDQNLIAGKTAGKQSVYHAIQEAKDSASAEEIAAMDKEIADLRENISIAKGLEKIMRAQLTALNATMSIQDLKTGILSAETTKEALQERLAPLRSGNVKPVSAEEKEEADHAWRVWSRHAAVRKKVCMNVWDYVTEELPEGKMKEELWEERGLEADD